MKKIIIGFCFFCLSVLSVQGNPFSAGAIPADLKKNAYGVVRFSTTEFEYKSEIQGTERNNYAVTILETNGKELSDFYCSTDKFRELKKFSAKLYDANGNLIRKYKLSDLSATEYSSSLATDARYYHMSCSSPVYPYTIHYEYEIEWKKGIFLFPPFMPQNAYNLSVEKADYLLKLPEGVKLRRKAFNMQDEPAVSTEKLITTYHWQAGNLSAIESEVFSPGLKTLVPSLLLSPESFSYDAITGTITDWNSYALWIGSLMEGRDNLSEAAKTNIRELTAGAQTDVEKVKILYDYLGETTRYVSIQLGIGGYQPMSASEVYKTGFGDCKALTFYLKSMLECIGIPSDYIGVRYDKKNKTLLHDYPSFQEINHVILRVPLPGDTLWLECTNTKNPFGFIHNGIAGHDALVITREGGFLQKLPDYPDTENIEKNIAKVTLSADGNATVNTTKEYHAKVYDNNAYFVSLKRNEQVDELRKAIELPNARINNIEIQDVKTAMPILNIKYDWSTTGYGSKTGNRLFIPVNPYRFQYNWFKKNTRNNDIFIHTGFNDIDSIHVVIPDGYEIESIPTGESIENELGSFSARFQHDDNSIYITQAFLFKAGNYSVEEYGKFRAFLDKINAAYAQKIILRKKTI